MLQITAADYAAASGSAAAPGIGDGAMPAAVLRGRPGGRTGGRQRWRGGMSPLWATCGAGRWRRGHAGWRTRGGCRFISAARPRHARLRPGIPQVPRSGAGAVIGWASLSFMRRPRRADEFRALEPARENAMSHRDRLAGHALVEALMAQGVETVFLVPGESYLSILTR